MGIIIWFMLPPICGAAHSRGSACDRVAWGEERSRARARAAAGAGRERRTIIIMSMSGICGRGPQRV